MAKWIHKRREFAAGYPIEGVGDIGTPPPEALGLTLIQKSRMRAAADKLLRLQNRSNQLRRLVSWHWPRLAVASIANIFERWVAGRDSPHTQRAYRQDVMALVS